MLEHRFFLGRRHVCSAVLFLVFVLILPVAVFAQTTTLNGVVRDPQDMVVPGAELTLTNSATAWSKTTLTDDEGRFAFAQLVPGEYQLKAELPGFKTINVEKLRLLVDTPTTLDLKFQMGEVTETVIVTGEQLLNKVDASIGNPFNEMQIVELPLESRNVFSLLTLQPGVTQAGYVAGARSDQSNLTLDGIDVNEQQQGTAFESVLRITPDSVQEFRVTTTNPNASQGRSSGAQVSLVTKSGTNDFHGSLYTYHRNTVTTANNFFNNRAVDEEGKPDPVERPALLRTLYGGTLGGPIVRDKFFFFFNYEGRKDRKQESIVQTVPLAHLGQGIVKYENTDGEIVSLSPNDINTLYPVGINPAATQALAEAAAKYPANDNTVGDSINTGGFRFNAPLPVDWNAYIARFDFLPNDSHMLAARLNYQSDNELRASAFPDTPAPALWTHPIGLALSDTWSISNTVQNTVRYGLTRQAFSQQGDSAENAISFRFVYSPLSFARTLSRTTPVHNFVDDLTWIKGDHQFQFGGNIRLVRNQRKSLAGTFDSAIINPYYYANSGSSLLDPIEDLGSGSDLALMSGVAAVLGRFSQYGAAYNFDVAGNPVPVGTPNAREFATEEYEWYAQDTWKLHPTLTLTAGVRWSMNTPVNETSGFQVKPTVSLGDYFERRKQAAYNGTVFEDIISIDTAGPHYNKPGWYEQEWDNFAPRASLAWSPDFDNGVLKAIFGSRGKSVMRGGFGMSYDRVGSALAVFFDLNNELGYSSGWTVPANAFNTSTRPAPLFTGFGQDIRNFPGVVVPDNLEFPLSHPADGSMRIESTLDDSIVTPVNYNWTFSWGRELPHGFFIEGMYIGRQARNLLAQRDVLPANNFRDPKSGMDWYQAARVLADARQNNVPIEDIPAIPYFENLFPDFVDGNHPYAAFPTPTQSVYFMVSRDGWDYPDWTFIQSGDTLNGMGIYPNIFFHPQWGSLTTWSTIARSDYHAFALNLRRRMAPLAFDFNYTFSKSIDNASGLQNEDAWDASAFIINSLRPDDMRSLSDFDITHIINANWDYALPFGKGHRFLSGLHPVAEAILGGWKSTGILRWNSGLPTGRTVDMSGWVTNWQIRSANVRIRPIEASPTKSGEAPNLFTDTEYAYQSFRTPYAGESGDRNIWRLQGYVALDLGVYKSFRMPFAEGHQLTFRWETFNVTNTQRLGGGISSLTMGLDPFLGEPGPDFGKITDIQGSPRVMQFGLRYDF
ncbi:MAG: carboxypeptidase regulatory-like domain-containing protein [Acidobacteriota bacterium]